MHICRYHRYPLKLRQRIPTWIWSGNRQQIFPTERVANRYTPYPYPLRPVPSRPASPHLHSLHTPIRASPQSRRMFCPFSICNGRWGRGPRSVPCGRLNHKLSRTQVWITFWADFGLSYLGTLFFILVIAKLLFMIVEKKELLSVFIIQFQSL